jgi:hypothetical protein
VELTTGRRVLRSLMPSEVREGEEEEEEEEGRESNGEETGIMQENRGEKMKERAE